jgi:predicted phage-related endonuclease
MKILHFDDRDEWLSARRGKITGTRVADIRPKTKGEGEKKGIYEMVAEIVAEIPENTDLEKPMDRGRRLEQEAINRFMVEKGVGVNTDLVIWQRDDDDRIAISPDGTISNSEAVEVKCLNSASHIEAWLTGKIPSEYQDQMKQYFVVNSKLKKLHIVFYDPRIPCKDFFIIEKLKDEEEIEKTLEMERTELKKIGELVARLKA